MAAGGDEGWRIEAFGPRRRFRASPRESHTERPSQSGRGLSRTHTPVFARLRQGGQASLVREWCRRELLLLRRSSPSDRLTPISGGASIGHSPDDDNRLAQLARPGPAWPKEQLWLLINNTQSCAASFSFFLTCHLGISSFP